MIVPLTHSALAMLERQSRKIINNFFIVIEIETYNHFTSFLDEKFNY
jgi:hypothetical protein